MKNLKYALGLLVLVICPQFARSQTINLNNGVALSKMKDMHILGDQIYTYSGSLSVDYIENEWYFLRSEIGYIHKGGKESVFVEVPPNIESEYRSLNLHYIHLNTTFNAQIKAGNGFLYLGIGPKLDILTKAKSGKEIDDLQDDWNIKDDIKTLSFGLKPVIGAYSDVGKIRLGVYYSYIVNIGKLRDDVNNTKFDIYNAKNNTMQIMFSVGYKL